MPTFKTLTASATTDEADESGLLDDEDSLPLVHAALFLGNADAFHLMGGGRDVDDGTLHNAALFALPRFVERLLRTHDPDCRLEEFDHMIPLALACSAKPHAWCAIANEEGTWEARQEETMRLLAVRTSPAWRYNHQTVLHVALGSGLAATRAMVKALDVAGDAQRDEKYLYRDKEGIELSPDQYVTRVLLDVSDEDKAALIGCLTKAGMTSRLFKRIGPGEGEQPTGYCGLPAELAAQWDDPTPVFPAEAVPPTREPTRTPIDPIELGWPGWRTGLAAARDSLESLRSRRSMERTRDSFADLRDSIESHLPVALVDGDEGLEAYYDDDEYDDLAMWTDTD